MHHTRASGNSRSSVPGKFAAVDVCTVKEGSHISNHPDKSKPNPQPVLEEEGNGKDSRGANRRWRNGRTAKRAELIDD